MSRAQERLLPTGTVELVIDLASGRVSDSVVAGVRSQPCTIERTAKDRLLGVHFKPGGAFPFLPFPFGDLHNLDITLDNLWGESKANQLLCLLQQTESIAAKFRILEQWLIGSAIRPLRYDPLVAFALVELECVPNRLTTAALADRANRSHRQFTRVFRDQVGLTPKLFARIQRFQRVLNAIHHRTTIDWAAGALSFGYYDQAHFIHDFQEFSELTPTKYLAARTQHLNHVILRD